MPRPIDVENIPFAAALKRRSIYDLKSSLDGYGREIFVESEMSPGRPKVYYRVEKHGNISRVEYRFPGWLVSSIGKSPYLPFDHRFSWEQ